MLVIVDARGHVPGPSRAQRVERRVAGCGTGALDARAVLLPAQPAQQLPPRPLNLRSHAQPRCGGGRTDSRSRYQLQVSNQC